MKSITGLQSTDIRNSCLAELIWMSPILFTLHGDGTQKLPTGGDWVLLARGTQYPLQEIRSLAYIRRYGRLLSGKGSQTSWPAVLTPATTPVNAHLLLAGSSMKPTKSLPSPWSLLVYFSK